MEDKTEKKVEEKAETKPIESKENFLKGNLLKAFVFAVLAVLAIVGTFYFESVYVDEAFVQENSSTKLLVPQNVIMNSDAVIELTDADGYLYNMKEGRLWADFSISNADTNIWIENIVLIPRNATFDLNYTGTKVELAVYSGDVYVGFWPDEDVPMGIIDQYSSGFLNSLLVPADSQVKMPIKKINENLRPLLTSKILKEFKYSAIPRSARDTEWVKENQAESDRMVIAYRQNYRSKILAGGEVDKDGLLNKFISWSIEHLTFVPEKKSEVQMRRVFVDLDAAIYYAVNENPGQMRSSLLAYRHAASSVLKKDSYQMQFDGYLRDLMAFGPGDLEYEVLLFLLDMSDAGSYQILDFYWYNVYRGIEQGQIEAEKALDVYYQRYSSTVASDDEEYRIYLAYQNQLFDNLFLRSSIFYKDAYFVMKEGFELALLDSYSNKRDKEELAQSFVARKIDFLRRLKKYFFNGDLEISEAKKIFKRLIGGARNLLPKDDDGGVAVITLFQKQLNDINDFWGYLNSSEYHGQLYGSSHEERYDVYLDERENIFSFVNIQEDVFGEVVEEVLTVFEVMEEVEKVFEEYEDVSDLEIVKIEDSAQRYIPINAVLGGYPLRADFDRDTGALKTVYVYDELVSDRAVRIDNLLPLLQNKFADLAEDVLEDDEVTLETTAQRTARLYIARLVSDYGFDVEIDDVSVFDDENAIYRVEKVIYDEYDKMELTFDLIMNGEIVTHLFMTVNRDPRVIDGEFTFEELVGLVEAERNFQENGVEYLLEAMREEDAVEAEAVEAEAEEVAEEGGGTEEMSDTIEDEMGEKTDEDLEEGDEEIDDTKEEEAVSENEASKDAISE